MLDYNFLNSSCHSFCVILLIFHVGAIVFLSLLMFFSCGVVVRLMLCCFIRVGVFACPV